MPGQIILIIAFCNWKVPGIWNLNAMCYLVYGKPRTSFILFIVGSRSMLWPSNVSSIYCNILLSFTVKSDNSPLVQVNKLIKHVIWTSSWMMFRIPRECLKLIVWTLHISALDHSVKLKFVSNVHVTYNNKLYQYGYASIILHRFWTYRALLLFIRPMFF